MSRRVSVNSALARKVPTQHLLESGHESDGDTALLGTVVVGDSAPTQDDAETDKQHVAQPENQDNDEAEKQGNAVAPEQVSKEPGQRSNEITGKQDVGETGEQANDIPGTQDNGISNYHINGITSNRNNAITSKRANAMSGNRNDGIARKQVNGVPGERKTVQTLNRDDRQLIARYTTVTSSYYYAPPSYQDNVMMTSQVDGRTRKLGKRSDPDYMHASFMIPFVYKHILDKIAYNWGTKEASGLVEEAIRIYLELLNNKAVVSQIREGKSIEDVVLDAVRSQ